MRDITSNVINTHLPCGTCGSSDALAEYDDGHTYCFACETYQGKGVGVTVKKKVVKDLIPLDSLILGALPARGITQETCRKFGYYKSQEKGRAIQVACYYNDDGDMIGQKLRFPDKEFCIKGTITDCFYGQHLFAAGGNKLIVTEGEIDALTVSQINGNKYPVVSLPKGAGSAKKTFKAQLAWLELFQEVIAMFDMDEPGRKAIKDIEGLLSPGKLKIATLPLKDPNECLKAGKPDEVIKAIFNAKTYRPDGIINGKDLKEEIMSPAAETMSYSFPWNIDLQHMTLGIRLGEMIMLTAGTGIGKTTTCRIIAHDLGVHKDVKVGLMMLEENKIRSAKGIMSAHIGKRLHIHWGDISQEERERAFNETLGTGNFVFYDHFGSIEEDNLINKMRYMIIGEGCQILILDHISIAISGLEGNDERKTIDKLMTKIRSLVEETGAGVIIISHLTKLPGDKKSHEQGAIISMDHLRGSGTLKQLPDTIIALERDQQAEGKEKNVVRVRLLKCRFTGETGIAGYLAYDKETDNYNVIENLEEYLAECIDLDEKGDTPF